MLKRFSRSLLQSEKRIKTARNKMRRLNMEQLDERRVMAGFDLESVFAFGNGTNATCAQGNVLTDKTGNSYVSGYFEGTVDFDPAQTHIGDVDLLTSIGTGRDLFIAKYDSNDVLVWAKRFGSDATVLNKEERIFGFTIDGNDNLYAAGKFQDTLSLDNFTIVSAGQTDGFLLKIDSQGVSQWAIGWGTSDDERGNGVAVSALGEVYTVGGRNVGTYSIGGTTEVRKFNPMDGSVLWSQNVGSDSSASMIAVDSKGNVDVSSTFRSAFDADPGPGQVILSQQGNDPNLGGSTYAIQFDANGKFNWARTFAAYTLPTGLSFAFSKLLAVDRDDNLIIAGEQAGQVDFDPSVENQVELASGNSRFIAKLNPQGGFEWVRGINGIHQFRGLQFDDANNMIVAGYVAGGGGQIDFDPGPGIDGFAPASGTWDSYLWGLTEAGEFKSITQFGAANATVQITGINLDSSNRMRVMGGFEGTVDFAPGPNVYPLSTVAQSAFSMHLNNTAGVTVSRRTGHVTSESGQSTYFKVSLDSRPGSDVYLPIASSDPSEGTVSVNGLTFTPSNWNKPQLVTVTGVDDALFDGNIAYTVVLAAAVSADSKYNGLNPADVSVVNLDNDVMPTKFYVVDDATQNMTYEYSANGSFVESYSLNSGNISPRGAVSNVAGDKTWVVDANRKVYVYNNSGGLLGSWTAGTLATNATVEGIATNGTDVWIVDNKADRVYRYSNAASLTTGTLNAVSSFALNSSNTNPKDIVTDGTSLWVVNDSTTDKVFKYTLSGTLVGSWAIDSANQSPTGITLDPSGASQSLWIVDNGTDRVYEYTNARSKSAGSQAYNVTFALAAGNTNPQGIADPPPSVYRLNYAGSLLISTAVLPTLQAMAPMLSLNNSAGSNPNAPLLVAFGSKIEALQTRYPSPRSHSTIDVSQLAFAHSLPVVSKVPPSLKASDHDSVLSNELFDGLDASLLESLASAR